MTNAQERYSLAELTEAAGVSVRTVRYYISEGLLPPPVGSGPKSYYTRSHLDRLRAIGRMRANYLPLKEIRRRLGAMSERQIREVATEQTAEAEEAAQSAETVATEWPAATDVVFDALPEPVLTAPFASLRRREDGERASDREMPAMPQRASTAETRVEEPAEPETWHRFKLGDEAELLIRSSLLRRRRDRVEWLVDWARKVFR
ncbi:MAG TPA: MerR family transcriptional regulator [Thermomicrobiales bacterium]|nr:MerR family transcriptional regulator [Thermomicrobiales bacterium]